MPFGTIKATGVYIWAWPDQTVGIAPAGDLSSKQSVMVSRSGSRLLLRRLAFCVWSADPRSEKKLRNYGRSDDSVWSARRNRESVPVSTETNLGQYCLFGRGTAKS